MSNDDRDGRASKDDGDGDSATSDGRSDRKRDEKRGDRGEESDKAKPKNFRLSRKTLIIGGVILGLILISVFLYWLHARNFESTNDAYTTTHVHEISARIDGTIESVNVNDNESVKAGQTLLGLDQRDLKVAAEQARAQLMQRRARGRSRPT
jgi:membrane fusion protein (multidrug efflux system)